jgi:hypothetical protein
MTDEPRRHTLDLSDQEIKMLERAVLAYAALMRIQTAAPSPKEADENSRVASLIQRHLHGTCQD